MNVTKWYGRSARFALAMVMTFGFAISAGAQTVLVDFGSNSSFRGTSVPNPDSNGNYWNSIVPGAFIVNMIDTGNIATTIDLGFDTGVGTDSFNGPAGPTTFPNPTPGEIAATDIDAAALGNLGIKEAAIDFAASPGAADNRTRFQLQELDPSKKYNLTFFGSHKFSDADTTIYSIYTDNTYSSLVDTASLNVQQPGSPNLHNRDTVATISGLSPQASNILYVEFVGTNNNLGYLNSMQITVVPEPGAALLMLSGLVAMLGFRRVVSRD